MLNKIEANYLKSRIFTKINNSFAELWSMASVKWRCVLFLESAQMKTKKIISDWRPTNKIQ